jgi:hypothetical protein
VPLYRNSGSINLLDPEGPFKACTWIAFARSKTFFNNLIVAYPLNPFSSCNVKQKVNCFGHRLAPTDPALESMNRVHTSTHYSFSVPIFGCFFLHLLSGFIIAFLPFAVLSGFLYISVFVVSHCGPRQSLFLCFGYPDNAL